MEIFVLVAFWFFTVRSCLKVRSFYFERKKGFIVGFIVSAALATWAASLLWG